MKVSCHLRALRGNRKLIELASSAGVHHATLSQIERGRMLPRQKDVEGLERAYGVPRHEWWPPAVVAAIDFTSD